MDKKATDIYQHDQEFRNTIATVDDRGNRIWVYPKKPFGGYHSKRVVTTAILLLLLFVGPFIQYNDRPFILLNFLERKFIFFGQVFWPQDFFLLALALITFFVFIILFTVVFGRIWCGWMCPQTLFMEMVFRKIEYWIEGNANEQRKLDISPWHIQKVVKKTSKHIIFLFISLLIAHLVMAYIIGVKEVLEVISQSPLENIGGFIAIIVFALLFYSVFSYFREQVCVVVCPYGRLQGVLLIKDSILVAYDWLRGEPRGKKKQSVVGGDKGDCVDCKLCVHVCPTGIDIRDGTQLECVNCTACMDACDEVMHKINKPKGLIRYSSHNGISQGKQKLFTTRVAGYSVVLTLLAVMLGYFMFTRSDIEATVFKMPGTLYSKTEDGKISNIYNIEFVNKTFDDALIEVRAEFPKMASLHSVGDSIVVVPKEGVLKKLFIIKLPEENIKNTKTTVTLGMYHNGKRLETMKARFIGPFKSSN